MGVVRVDPGFEPAVGDIDGSLESMQAVVGGTIQICHSVDTSGHRAILFYCNEDGRAQNLAPNRKVNGQVVLGTILVMVLEGEDNAELTAKEAADVVQVAKEWPRVTRD
jgi:hypothetical protein